MLASCASKYSPIKSSDDELRIVGHVGEYPVYYDELRCSVMNAKKVMGEYYGIDPDSDEFAQKYGEELKTRVFNGLKYNYAVQILFADGGYTIDDQNIQSAVQSKIEELINECGSRKKYVEYLEENLKRISVKKGDMICISPFLVNRQMQLPDRVCRIQMPPP